MSYVLAALAGAYVAGWLWYFGVLMLDVLKPPGYRRTLPEWLLDIAIAAALATGWLVWFLIALDQG